MKMKERYKLNKGLKVGDKCICPSCGSEFTKEHYQQAFCKSYGGTVCKDKYWNTVTPEKRCNTTRISPANAAYQARNIRPENPLYGKFNGYTSEGYRIFGTTALDEWDEPIYGVYGLGDYDEGDYEYWDNSDNGREY